METFILSCCPIDMVSFILCIWLLGCFFGILVNRQTNASNVHKLGIFWGNCYKATNLGKLCAFFQGIRIINSYQSLGEIEPKYVGLYWKSKFQRHLACLNLSICCVFRNLDLLLSFTFFGLSFGNVLYRLFKTYLYLNFAVQYISLMVCLIRPENLNCLLY